MWWFLPISLRHEKDPDGLVADYPGLIPDRLGNGEGAKALFPLRSRYNAICTPIQVLRVVIGSRESPAFRLGSLMRPIVPLASISY
jgi:hypothetical protein